MRTRPANPLLPLAIAGLITLAGGPAGFAQSEPPRASAEEISSRVDAAARAELVETLASGLVKDYARPEPGRKMAELIRARLAGGAYDKITSAEEFARALQADIRGITDDKHLRVSFEAHPAPGPSGGPPPAMIAQMRASVPRVAILEGNIGYMEVNSVPALPLSKQAITAAFALLHDTDALIIDSRANGGGDPRTVALYMSYLSEGAPYVTQTIHWRKGDHVESFKTTDLGVLSYGAKKPVFYLTSPRTFSGGEEFAYDLQAFKRGVLVGETTGGGANPGGNRYLGRGFSVFLPEGYGVHPVTGGNWEGVGVKPDVAVPADQALTTARRMALDRLKAEAVDPVQRATLDTLGRRLQTEPVPAVAARPGRLGNSLLVGRYASVGAGGPNPSIAEREGELFLKTSANAPAARLVLLEGDRYRLAGLPEDFTATFSRKGEQVDLVLQLGGAVVLTEKQ